VAAVFEMEIGPTDEYHRLLGQPLHLDTRREAIRRRHQREVE
jgi:hypothetical protein